MLHVDFRTCPAKYRHWRLVVDGRWPRSPWMWRAGRPRGPAYELKAELLRPGRRHRAVRRGAAAAVRAPGSEGRGSHQRQGPHLLRGANIRMLGRRVAPWKVNFCKFTNETRNGIEDANGELGPDLDRGAQRHRLGRGYELALACEHIMLVDDRSSAVSLPELPLLGVLPGTAPHPGGRQAARRRDLATTSPPGRRGSGGRRRLRGSSSMRPCRERAGKKWWRNGPATSHRRPPVCPAGRPSR